MFRFIAVIFIFISTILAADEQTDIQNTISNQLEAFASDDFTEAFTHASPGIKDIFGSVDNFSRMVKKGYPMAVSYTHLTLPTILLV